MAKGISIEDEFRVQQDMGYDLNEPENGELFSVKAAGSGLFEHVERLIHTFHVDVMSTTETRDWRDSAYKGQMERS